jgi:hypothetical protein
VLFRRRYVAILGHSGTPQTGQMNRRRVRPHSPAARPALMRNAPPNMATEPTCLASNSPGEGALKAVRYPRNLTACSLG